MVKVKRADPRPSVKVTMRNRQTLFMSEYPEALRECFSYRAPGYNFSSAYKMGTWDGMTCMIKRGRVSTGLFLELRDAVEAQLGIRFLVFDTRTTPEFHDMPARLAARVRPHQLEAADAMRAASASGGIVLNATGTGKTFLAGVYLSQLVGSAIFLVDELGLLDQARKELSQVLKEQVGMVGGSVFDPRRVTVAMRQTLNLKKHTLPYRAWFKRVEVVIIDELHVALNRTTAAVIAAVNPMAVFGLTATLEMKKRDVLMRATAMVGPLLHEYSLRQGVGEDVLSKGVVCCVPCTQTEEKTSYVADYTRVIVEGRKRNRYVRELAAAGVDAGHRVLVLVERVGHINALSKSLRHIPHRVAWGKVSTVDRTKARRDMEQGDLQLIIANRVFAKAANIKACDMIIDATAGVSRNNTLQRYGRGTRKLYGKEGLLYLNISDVGNRFSLSDKKRRKAFQAEGVHVEVIKWTTAEEVVARATKILKRVIRGPLV